MDPRRNRIIKTYYDYACDLQYKERPVSMKEFLSNDRYFGKLTGGGKMIYPIWMDELSQISREDSKYLIVLSGAIGTGKSRAAIYDCGYTMYRCLCLREPWEHFKKTGGGKMAIVFFNLTKSLGNSIGFNLLQRHLLASPWFREKGIISSSKTNPRIEFPLFEYKLASPYSKGFGTVGSDVIWALMDEVDDPSESDKQRIRVLKAYESTMRRFESRFVYDGESLGRFFLVASKQEQLSFLSTFIVKMKSSPNVYIIDIPIWAARSKSDYCGEKFPVMIGDVYTPSKILSTKDENGKVYYDKEIVKNVIREGFQVIYVPVEYYLDFQRDIAGALRDLAGISVSYIRKSKLFPSEKLLVNCYDPTKLDPVKQLTVKIGLEDDIDLVNFLDLSRIRIARNVPRYIHVDIAYSGNGDALGIAMSCIKGWSKENTELEDGTFRTTRMPVVETDFAMRIHAPQGDKIPFNKIRKFILDLKNIYRFNLVLVTFDLQTMSEDSMQILGRAGVKCEALSLDKDSSIYRGFAGLVKEQRWICHRNEYLHFELVNLEDDPVTNKIDHPDEVLDIEMLEDGNTREVVLMGSKDIADATAGSVYSAIKNCETPPDVEVMKDMLNKSITHSEEERSKLWFLDRDTQSIDTKNSKKPDEKDKKLQNFKDIFKKAQQ